MTSPKKHTQLLQQLNAPLRLPQQSWGSVRESDGAVFLVLWQDHVKKINDKLFVRITDQNKYADDSRYGARERLQHIDLIYHGAECYIVMAIAKDPKVRPRTVKELARDNEVFLAGEIIEHDSALWIALEKPKPIGDLLI